MPYPESGTVHSDPDDPHAYGDVRDRHALLREALAPWTLGHNLNFLYGYGEDAGESQTRAGYEPATYERRLAALKAAYDPRNLFRLNRTIQPGPARPQNEPPGHEHGGAPARPVGLIGNGTAKEQPLRPLSRLARVYVGVAWGYLPQ